MADIKILEMNDNMIKLYENYIMNNKNNICIKNNKKYFLS